MKCTCLLPKASASKFKDLPEEEEAPSVTQHRQTAPGPAGSQPSETSDMCEARRGKGVPHAASLGAHNPPTAAADLRGEKGENLKALGLQRPLFSLMDKVKVKKTEQTRPEPKVTEATGAGRRVCPGLNVAGRPARRGSHPSLSRHLCAAGGGEKQGVTGPGRGSWRNPGRALNMHT